jgi:hypothetical protein
MASRIMRAFSYSEESLKGVNYQKYLELLDTFYSSDWNG